MYFPKVIQKKNSQNAHTKISIKEGVGIIYISGIMADDPSHSNRCFDDLVSKFTDELERISHRVTKGWIFDMTDNWGGDYVPMIAMLSYFIHNPAIGGFQQYDASYKQYIFQLSFDGQHFSQDGDRFVSYRYPLPFAVNALPVIVLINENTASSGEFTALALQRQPGVLLAGHSTYGNASVNALMELPEKSGFYLLTIGHDLDQQDQPILDTTVHPDLIIENKVTVDKGIALLH